MSHSVSQANLSLLIAQSQSQTRRLWNLPVCLPAKARPHLLRPPLPQFCPPLMVVGHIVGRNTAKSLHSITLNHICESLEVAQSETTPPRAVFTRRGLRSTTQSPQKHKETVMAREGATTGEVTDTHLWDTKRCRGTVISATFDEISRSQKLKNSSAFNDSRKSNVFLICIYGSISSGSSFSKTEKKQDETEKL